MRMHAHLLSTQLVLDTFDTGFKSTQNQIEIKFLVSFQSYDALLIKERATITVGVTADSAVMPTSIVV